MVKVFYVLHKFLGESDAFLQALAHDPWICGSAAICSAIKAYTFSLSI